MNVLAQPLSQGSLLGLLAQEQGQRSIKSRL